MCVILRVYSAIVTLINAKFAHLKAFLVKILKNANVLKMLT
jgi:hypothetical protein